MLPRKTPVTPLDMQAAKTSDLEAVHSSCLDLLVAGGLDLHCNPDTTPQQYVSSVCFFFHSFTPYQHPREQNSSASASGPLAEVLSDKV